MFDQGIDWVGGSNDKDNKIILKDSSLQQIVSWRIREEKIIILIISATVVVVSSTATISVVIVIIAAAKLRIVKNILMFINLVLLESELSVF